MTASFVALGAVADIQLGKMLSPNAKTGGESWPYLRNANVQWGRLELGDMSEMDFSDDERVKFSIERGDLLVCEGGEPGRCAVVDRDLPGVYFQKALMRVRPNSRQIDVRYLQHFMAYAAGRGAFMKGGNQATIAHFPAVRLSAFEVPLLPIIEQRRIADVLDKADAIRRKRKQAIDLTGDLIRSTFLDMFGDPVTNPNGWETKSLSELALITTGNTPPRAIEAYYGDDIEWIKSDNINTPSHWLTPATEGLSVKGRAIGRTAPTGSSLVTCIAGSPDCIGNVALADREVAFNQQINALSPNKGVDHRFLYGLLLVGKRLVQAASTNGMKGMVSKGKLEAIQVPSPPLEAQARFGSIFDHVVRLDSQQETARRESLELFDSAQQRAF